MFIQDNNRQPIKHNKHSRVQVLSQQ